MRWACALACGLLLGLVPASVRGQRPEDAQDVLLRRIDSIHARSPAFAAALDSAVVNGGRIILATPAQTLGLPEGFADTEIAGTEPVVDADGAVRRVVVVVNYTLIATFHTDHDALGRDLDRILIHEVYGHALPYLIAGSLAGKCADPEPAATDPAAACSIRRENVVRGELGLGRRLDYGLESLELSGTRLGYF